MEDVQNYSDPRRMDIDRVGVRCLRYPIHVLDRQSEVQQTIAEISMAVRLPHQFKGTHMSRFVEVLNQHRGEVTMRTLPSILAELKDRLEADSAHVQVVFPYFIEREAPVSGARSLMEYECTFIAETNGGSDDFVLGVKVPVTTLCPCSKTISEYGAHNQRGYVTIEVRSHRDTSGIPLIVWIEDVVAIAEESASAPVYPLLKRSDERHVTMQAYDNPVFVEDVVRAASGKLRSDARIAWHRVEAETLESIHNHNAYAEIVWDGTSRNSDQAGIEGVEISDLGNAEPAMLEA